MFFFIISTLKLVERRIIQLKKVNLEKKVLKNKVQSKNQKRIHFTAKKQNDFFFVSLKHFFTNNINKLTSNNKKEHKGLPHT